MRRLRITLILIALPLLTGIFFAVSKKKPETIPLPPAQSYNSTASSQTQSPAPSEPETALPAEVNLAIPFTSQAPHQNWDLPYQQFCEEASVLMAASFVKGENILGPDDSDKKMLAIKDFEEKKFGYYEDTTAEETAVILRENFELANVEVVFDPTSEKIKKALAGSKAVILPLAGREIGNPNYRQPGPLYHMLVVKGYTKSGNLITNDPGTRKGADYVYKPEVLLNAVHDWNGGNVDTGRKVMIIIG